MVSVLSMFICKSATYPHTSLVTNSPNVNKVAGKQASHNRNLRVSIPDLLTNHSWHVQVKSQVLWL